MLLRKCHQFFSRDETISTCRLPVVCLLTSCPYRLLPIPPLTNPKLLLPSVPSTNRICSIEECSEYDGEEPVGCMRCRPGLLGCWVCIFVRWVAIRVRIFTCKYGRGYKSNIHRHGELLLAQRRRLSILVVPIRSICNGGNYRRGDTCRTVPNGSVPGLFRRSDRICLSSHRTCSLEPKWIPIGHVYWRTVVGRWNDRLFWR